ncbi:MAG: serine O-acetyltransferase [Candidatus Omnitrophica bacterium]|nr:serine O-acetyltransferase [Candidatus Omnitrophota bacterium]
MLIFFIAAVFVCVALILIAVIFDDNIRAVFDRDPAACGRIEVILTYAGLHAIILFRIAHFFYSLKVPLLPRFISQAARFMTGIEIHPGAVIGKGLFIDHGMGVVIGQTTVIRDNVTIFQGVTLGGTGKEKGKRHPNIEDNVVIGAGAKVLGNITIGANSYIGANAVVIKDVPENSTIVGVPGRITKQAGKRMDLSLDHVHMLDPIKQSMEMLEKRIADLEKK